MFKAVQATEARAARKLNVSRALLSINALCLLLDVCYNIYYGNYAMRCDMSMPLATIVTV